MLNQLNTTTKSELDAKYLTSTDLDGIEDDIEQIQGTISDLQDDVSAISNRVNTYLDTEQIVGRFGDTPLYQITIDFGALPNATTKTVLTEVLAEDIIRVDVLANTKTATGTGYKNVVQNVPNGYVGGGDITFLARINNDDKIEISLTTGNDRTSYNALVTIQYTKPTQTETQP